MTDRELRDLLHDAVRDVGPTRDLDDVRRAGPAPRRGWVPLTVAAAVATALVLVGIPWLAGREAAAPPAAGPATGPATGPVDVVAYAVTDTPAGVRLSADRRVAQGVDSPAGRLEAAVRETLTGPPADPDVRPVVPAGTFAEVSVTTEPGAVAVDLPAPAGTPASSEDAALWGQAVAWTVRTAVGEPVPVRLSVDGAATGELLGAALRDPVVADPAVLAAVVVESVGEGETVASPVTVSGLATAFEGTVAWRLLDGPEVVREGFTTAAQCCTPSPYSFELDAPPGDYVLEVSETDPSDGEGLAPYTATTRLRLR